MFKQKIFFNKKAKVFSTLFLVRLVAQVHVPQQRCRLQEQNPELVRNEGEIAKLNREPDRPRAHLQPQPPPQPPLPHFGPLRPGKDWVEGEEHGQDDGRSDQLVHEQGRDGPELPEVQYSHGQRADWSEDDEAHRAHHSRPFNVDVPEVFCLDNLGAQVPAGGQDHRRGDLRFEGVPVHELTVKPKHLKSSFCKSV